MGGSLCAETLSARRTCGMRVLLPVGLRRAPRRLLQTAMIPAVVQPTPSQGGSVGPLGSGASGPESVHPLVSQAVRPIYIAAGRPHRSLAAALAACSDLELDWEAINCFLRTGFYLGGRTPFKQLGLQTVLPPPLPHSTLGRTAVVDGYIELFRNAVVRMARSDAAIGLSGGADSRHIALELTRAGRPPAIAWTVRLPGSEDAAVAQRLAQRLGIPHELLSATDAARDERRKSSLTDFRSLQHRWFMAVVDRIDRPAWWDGIGGDVLSAGLFLEPWNLSLMQAGRFEALADRMVSRGKVYWFGAPGEFRREQAVHDLATELARHAAAANPIGSFYFWNRTCQDIAAASFGALERRGVAVLAPYLERELWEFLASVPASVMLDHRLHVEAIAKAHPDFADLPYARKLNMPAAIQRARGRGVMPLLSRRFARRPDATSLKALLHSMRAAVTGHGHPGALLEMLVYADDVTATLRTGRRPAPAHSELDVASTP